MFYQVAYQWRVTRTTTEEFVSHLTSARAEDLAELEYWNPRDDVDPDDPDNDREFEPAARRVDISCAELVVVSVTVVHDETRDEFSHLRGEECHLCDLDVPPDEDDEDDEASDYRRYDQNRRTFWLPTAALGHVLVDPRGNICEVETWLPQPDGSVRFTVADYPDVVWDWPASPTESWDWQRWYRPGDRVLDADGQEILVVDVDNHSLLVETSKGDSCDLHDILNHGWHWVEEDDTEEVVEDTV